MQSASLKTHFFQVLQIYSMWNKNIQYFRSLLFSLGSNWLLPSHAALPSIYISLDDTFLLLHAIHNMLHYTQLMALPIHIIYTKTALCYYSKYMKCAKPLQADSLKIKERLNVCSRDCFVKVQINYVHGLFLWNVEYTWKDFDSVHSALQSKECSNFHWILNRPLIL